MTPISPVPHSEKKIDNISEGINEIKRLLRERSQSPKAHHPSHRIDLDSPPVKDTPENGRQSPCPFTGESSFTAHSLDAKRFVESIAAQTSLDGSDLERDDLLACLRELLRYKNDQIVVHQMSFLDEPISTSIARTTEEVTPLEAAVFILRWAKGTALCSSSIHSFPLVTSPPIESSSSYIVTWISQILPLERIIGICQKVYFSVHDYSEVEFIIANGCLYWLYWEYAALFKRPEFQQYGIQCRDNIQLAFSRLPFLLPASMEVIAAMVIGVSQSPQHSLLTGIKLNKS